MTKFSNNILWGLVIFTAILLQFSLIMTELKENPNKVAINFSKAYFSLDPNMNKYFSEKISKYETKNIVNRHLHLISKNAMDRGFDFSSMKRHIFNIQTETLYIGSESVKVKIKASSKIHYNFIFTWVSKIFNIGNIHNVNYTITLVKDKSKWKINKFPFELYQNL